MILGYVSGGALYWVHQDHIGQPLLVAAQNGDLQWWARYKPFGAILTGKTGGAVPINLRYPGQYHDWESGLRYNGFRDYDAYLGRYAQSDPIGLRGGWNTYVYVGGNPVRYADPAGLAKEDCEGDWVFIKDRIGDWIDELYEGDAPPDTPFLTYVYNCTCIWSCYKCFRTRREKLLRTREIPSKAFENVFGGEPKCDCRKPPGDSNNNPCPEKRSCLTQPENQQPEMPV